MLSRRSIALGHNGTRVPTVVVGNAYEDINGETSRNDYIYQVEEQYNDNRGSRAALDP